MSSRVDLDREASVINTPEKLAALRQFDLVDQAWENLLSNASNASNLSNVIPVQDYQLGGFVFRLWFSDEGIKEKIAVAFSHLEIPLVQTPDLTIRVWDFKATGTRMPVLDWTVINSNGCLGYEQSPVYLQFPGGAGPLNMLHTERKVAYFITRDALSLPLWVIGAPLSALLSVCLQKQGLQFIHAAAVGNEHSSVLLTGKGGSGKSTTALSCLRAGLNYIGEDYCVVRAGSPRPTVYSVYQAAKWTLNTCHFFPDYKNFIKNPEQAKTEKALVYYQDFFSQQIKTSCSIKAAISVTVGTAQQPILKAQNKQEAFKHIALSTVMQLPFTAGAITKNLQSVLAPIDCYQLFLGWDRDANVDLIKNILLEN